MPVVYSTALSPSISGSVSVRQLLRVKVGKCGTFRGFKKMGWELTDDQIEEAPNA